jgi:molybdate transport system substrate-binding protein
MYRDRARETRLRRKDLGANLTETVTVLSTLATEQAYHELLPAFEQATGHKVVTSFTGTVDVKKRIAAGEAFDLLIMASDDIDAFLASGMLASGSRADLASSGIGVAVRSGAAKPAIGTTTALTAALLAAATIGYSTGPSGNYVLGLFDKLGIAEKIKPKLRLAPTGAFVGSLIASGEAEIGFQQMSELSHFPGIALVGPLPAEIQKTTVFSSGIAAKAKQADAARTLAKFLTAPTAAPVFRRHGLQPAQ